MVDSDQRQMKTEPFISATTTLHITVAVVILNLVFFVIILLFYLRTKGCFGRVRHSRSRRLIFAPYEPSLPRHALDQSILNALPATVFRAEDFKEEEGLECAVCISELTDGEEVRILPKCRHGFHVECIDMWFHSNSTCPLCRSPVSANVSDESSAEPAESISETGPSTNLNERSVSFAGPSCSSGTSSSFGKGKGGMLVIDIPRQAANGFSSTNSPFPLSRASPSSGRMSPAASGRMRSMRRMLSRGSAKGAGPSCSPRGCDVEQGEVTDSKCQ